MFFSFLWYFLKAPPKPSPSRSFGREDLKMGAQSATLNLAEFTGFAEVRAPCPLPRITQIYNAQIPECKSDLLMFGIYGTLFGVGGILVKNMTDDG
jgi:hypothetical protein